MSRNYQTRRSLDHFGIPDNYDMLAVYIRWARQRHYLARSRIRAQPSSSTGGETASIGAHMSYPSAAGAQIPVADSGSYFIGIGSCFDDEAENVEYPRELDLQG